MQLLNAAGDTELAPGAVQEHLARAGLVRIRHGDLTKLRALLGSWTTPYRHPHESEPGATAISPGWDSDADVGRAGFTHRLLAPHTDRSLQRDSPSVLAAVLVTPAATGGHALLADGAAVLATLLRTHGASAVSKLRLCTADGVTVPIVATCGGLTRIRFRDDRLAAPCSVDGDEGLVTALRQAVAAATWSLPLAEGDGYLIHNLRYLHGRTSFTGNRKLVRLLATVRASRLAWLNQGFSGADL